jgi:hypothetical protein
MTPSREVRYTDAMKLSFPLQMVLVIVAACISAAGSVWAVNAATRADNAAIHSDIRDIKTSMDGQIRLQDERASTLKSNIDTLQRDMRWQQVEIQNLKEMVLGAKPKGATR